MRVPYGDKRLMNAQSGSGNRRRMEQAVHLGGLG